MIALALVVLALIVPFSQEEKKKPIPKDSVEVATEGCLKGRVFTATEPSIEEERVERAGPDVTGQSFRINGPRPVMDEVKKHNGHLVEVVGVVRKSDIANNAPGKRIGNTRVTIGLPQRSGDPNYSHTPMANVVVMDVTSVRFLSQTCPIPRS